MNKDDYKILNQEIIFQGYCQIERYELQNRKFSGEWSKPYLREIVRRYNASVALLYDPNLNKVVLIEQFRAPAIWSGKSPWLLELVAGVNDKEESFSDLIRREVLEEAGLEALEVIPIYTYLASPGGNTEEVSLFCVRVDASKAPKFCGLEEENEDIRVHLFSPEETFAAIRDGRIHNASAIIAIQWLELNLESLQKRWLK
jgi:ADP-ribose pyrophosphatase